MQNKQNDWMAFFEKMYIWGLFETLSYSFRKGKRLP